MEWLVGVGSLSLGLLIGGLVALYVVGTDKFNLGALTGAVSTLAGAGVIAVFHAVAGKDTPADPRYWWYPIGLLIGAVIVGLIKGKI
jgi:hypothetical protein